MKQDESIKQASMQRLSQHQIDVCWNKATEPAFSGKYTDEKALGEYQCVCCGAVLFISTHKYDSGSGWPSFYQATPEAIHEEIDTSHHMQRTEICCAKCGSHLGHVFPDGPQPTGLRYCVNSASLKFVAH